MIAALIVILLLSAPWHAFVTMKLWLWFAVPLLHVDPLTFKATFGISMLVAMLTHKVPQYKKEKNEITEGHVQHAIAVGLVSPGFALIAGWLFS